MVQRAVVTGQFPFAALMNDTETWLVSALQLEPCAVDQRLAHATGSWKNAPVTISTAAYCGPRIRYARFVTMQGEQIEIGNLLCLPDPLWPLPILGGDLVAVGRETAMLAIDLSPTLPIGPERERQLAPLAALRTSQPQLPLGGPLPAWCRDWFSDHGLYTRVTATEFDAAAAVFCGFPKLFTRLTCDGLSVSTSRDTTSAAQTGYVAAHRTDDKGLGLLATIFGAAWAAQYLGEVLFPEHLVTPGHG